MQYGILLYIHAEVIFGSPGSPNCAGNGICRIIFNDQSMETQSLLEICACKRTPAILRTADNGTKLEIVFSSMPESLKPEGDFLYMPDYLCLPVSIVNRLHLKSECLKPGYYSIGKNLIGEVVITCILTGNRKQTMGNTDTHSVLYQ